MQIVHSKIWTKVCQKETLKSALFYREFENWIESRKAQRGVEKLGFDDTRWGVEVKLKLYILESIQ